MKFSIKIFLGILSYSILIILPTHPSLLILIQEIFLVLISV